MQLLVFAHTPPPIHGQSLMVQTLVEGLPSIITPLRVFHVNPRLSRDSSDVGRWRLGKFFALVAACGRALRLRARHGRTIFYYVPAPARRGALYRDWLVMLLCRPFFGALVLHWHAVGLGEWLVRRATPPERWLTRALLGRATLSIALAPELIADAQLLSPRRIAIVPNGVADPGAPTPRDRAVTTPFEILFLGLGSREKGLFDTLTAVEIALAREPGGFRLTVAGGFASAADNRAFLARAKTLGADVVQHIGFADEARKRALFASADVFCFPTSHPYEGQPLALIEALAHDVPIITTRWRAIPGMLPTTHVWFVDPARPDQIAEALLAARRSERPHGKLREHYLAHFTRERHLEELATALLSLE